MSVTYSIDSLQDDMVEHANSIITALIESGQSKEEIFDILYDIAEDYDLDIDTLPSVLAASEAGQKMCDSYLEELEQEPDDYGPDFEDNDQEFNESGQAYDEYERTSGTRGNSNFSCFGLYLNDVRKIPLLTREEEIRYAKMAQSPNKKIAKEGRDALVTHNLRLVIKCAKHRTRPPGMDLSDLVSAGNKGLLKAAEKYDYTRDNRFSTYATYQIKNEMTIAICKEGYIIRPPANQLVEKNKLIRYQQEYVIAHEKDPSIEEMAVFLINLRYESKYKCPPLDTYVKKNLNKFSKIVFEYMRPIWNTTHLAEFVGGNNSDDDAGNTIEDVTPDYSAPDPSDEAIKREFHDEIKLLLESLTPLECKVLKALFGFECAQYKSKEIGRIYGLSEKEVDTAIKSGMKKLKGTARVKLSSSWL